MSIKRGRILQNCIRLPESNGRTGRKEKKSGSRKNGEWLRIQLLPAATIQELNILPSLFSKTIYLPVVALTYAWLLAMLIIYTPSRIAAMYASLNAIQVLQWTIGIAAVAALHECGHASALLHCGGRPGGIGISMRCLLPRGWSEINDVGKLIAKERLLVDNGGIYVQLLFTMILYVLNLSLIKNPVLLAVCVSSAVMALINLIPNRGTDGYWMIKDAFGIEDIVQHAKALIGKSSGRPTRNKRQKKVHFVFLVIFRNLAIVYLLMLILTVFMVALNTMTADAVAISSQINPAAILQIMWNRLGCLVAIAVVIQNVFVSVGKSGKENRSGLEETGEIG